MGLFVAQRSGQNTSLSAAVRLQCEALSRDQCRSFRTGIRVSRAETRPAFCPRSDSCCRARNQILEVLVIRLVFLELSRLKFFFLQKVHLNRSKDSFEKPVCSENKESHKSITINFHR